MLSWNPSRSVLATLASSMHLLRVFVSLNALLAAAIWTGVIIWLVGLALSVGYPTVARYTINLGLGLWVLLPLAIAPSIMAMFLWDRRLQFVPHLHPPLGLALVGMAGVTDIDVTLTLWWLNLALPPVLSRLIAFGPWTAICWLAMRSRWYPWPRPLLGFAVAAKNNAMLAGLGVTGMDSPVLRAGAITGGIVVSLLLRSRTFNRPPDCLRRNADDDRNESPRPRL